MKTKMVRWATVNGLVIAALAACSAAADASAATPGAGGQAMHRPDPARFVQHFDKDGNGTVELSELPPRMQERMAKADANQDGKITVEELKAHAEARRKQMFEHLDKDKNGALTAAEVGDRWEHLKVADADGNGSITQAELDQAHAEHKLHGGCGGPGGHRGHGPRGEAFFKDKDKNGDGALTADEVGERAWAHISKADANSDGKVTKAELEQARAARASR